MRGVNWIRCGLLVFCAVASAGCGDSKAAQQLDLAKRAVQTSLDAWQTGQSGDVLRPQVDGAAIEFHDDDCQQKAKLVQFEIKKTYLETDGTPRCAVSLEIQRGTNPAERLNVTYQVVTQPKIVIARDPFS